VRRKEGGETRQNKASGPFKKKPSKGRVWLEHGSLIKQMTANEKRESETPREEKEIKDAKVQKEDQKIKKVNQT